MLSKKMIVCAGLVFLSMFGCGVDVGVQNVAQCERWKIGIQCGQFDTNTIKCDHFAGVKCDISSYFNCLTERFACKEFAGMKIPDVVQWQGCMPLSKCPD